MVKFCRLDLRTTDADAARAFYSKILGHDRATIWPLHEQALARGARPHWLGRLGVENVERASAALVERGATPLGPTRPTDDGGQVAVLRDPGGAIVTVGTLPRDTKAGVEADWYLLNTNDAARAIVNYRELFGWEIKERAEVSAHGTFHPFAWHAGGPNVGAIIDITGMAGRHPHWLYFFGMDALEPAMEVTRAAGGLVLDPVVLPSGERVCVCDDPQGAAFALLERRR